MSNLKYRVSKVQAQLATVVYLPVMLVLMMADKV
jgi:hypothetical protein